MLGENAHAANQNVTRSAPRNFKCPSAIAASLSKMSENAVYVNSPFLIGQYLSTPVREELTAPQRETAGSQVPLWSTSGHTDSHWQTLAPTHFSGEGQSASRQHSPAPSSALDLHVPWVEPCESQTAFTHSPPFPQSSSR